MKGKGILLFATMMFAYLHHLVSGAIDISQEDLKFIHDQIEEANITLTRYTPLNVELIGLVGKSVAGNVDLDSILHRLEFAYHIGYPADPDYWGSAYYHVKQEHFVPLQKVRQAQEVWEAVENYGTNCNKALAQKRASRQDAFTPEIDEILAECIDTNAPIQIYIESVDLSYPSLGVLYNLTRLRAVYVVASHYKFMLFVDEDQYGFEDADLTDTYSVRLGPINRMADEANLDHYEMTRRIKEFQQRINDPTAKMSPEERKFNQAKLEEIKEELQNPPFDWIYSNGDDGPVDLRRECSHHLKQEFEAKFPDLFSWIYETEPGTDMTMAERWVSNTSGIDWEADFDTLKNDTIRFYQTYFHINGTWNEWVWDWDVKNADTCAKFVRDSWERLDNIVEKLKCYMGESYYFSKGVRKRAIQLTQLDLAEAKLFSNISTTLFKPCRVTDDNDLVSTCTRENHEICAPMFFYRDVGQNPAFDNHGGVSLLRQKAYYRFNETAKECEPVKTFIVPYKMCQCGFRTDCGKDLGGNLTCQLSADFLRKQCRGTSAYPCKSLPLAPGRHHESCLSGYCDIEMNSCEDGPPLVLQKTSRGYDLKINHWPITISMIGVIYSLKVQYYG